MNWIEYLPQLRGLHVLGVVWWIGGVAVVTTAILPRGDSALNPQERLALFNEVESRFSRQARWAVLLVGATGVLMLHASHGWARYQSLQFWWLHAMTLVWLVFALMLFLLEPFVLKHHFRDLQKRDPQVTLRRLQRVHVILLIASLLTIFGAVAGSHGLAFFR